MVKSKKHIIILFLASIIIGVSCDFGKSFYNLEAKKIQTFNKDGEVTTLIKYDFPLKHTLLGIISIVFYSLGFSIFITGFISSKLDEQIRRKEEDEYKLFHKIKEEELEKLRTSINIDVFDSLFKTLVPDEIFKVIKHQIIENKIIRKDARWYLDFTELDGNKIQLKQTLKYTLINLSQQEVSNPVKIHTGTEQGTITELLSAKYRIEGKEVICFPIKGENDKLNIEDIENEAYQKLIEYNITVPANSSVEATTVLNHTYNKLTVQDQYITRYPIINGTLVVTHPVEYNFKLFSAMSNPLKPDIEENDRKTYELIGAALPFQSFIYLLEKITTP